MKTIIKRISVVLLFIVLFGTVSYYSSQYTKTNCTVLQATETGAIIEDLQGHIWYYETGGFHKGERVTMKMHSNYTDGYIEDDIILAVVKRDC